ncbi:MAG: FAD-binding protein [Deltaproteobacteria bacterium]|jgi:glycolate oxidase|nr:FAD-binding protein [Deltaproteobacteria bacterium]MBT4641110.1 FAD-binding protein [Deltaproteobacteria bacterium]MBT7155100.1 FAD-binding protein [Deltaproteobacteria bacterium]MBT7714766.1 FAD-binding protein [Deltaproteobacteria bacterium]MBT7890768.1 FAD-binding protein [Deltaproteobacteria bacterium]
MNGLAKDLGQLIGSQSVKTDPVDLLAYEADATHYFARGKPDAIVLPQTAEDISKVLRYASNTANLPVTPRGAGSGLSGACTPTQGGIVMDMKRMNQILEINSGNLTARAEAGVVLSHFHRAVEKLTLFYPPDPQSMTVCTLGGNVSTRAGGPHGVKYGTTSNYVLGLEVVLPDGSIINTGSTCVKHSVGYDLTHLMTGSEGTLGVITNITLRLLPLPPMDRTIIVSCETAETASETVSAIIAAGMVPAMLEYVSKGAIRLMGNILNPPLEPDGEACLFIKLDGQERQIVDESRRIESICRDMKALDVRVIEDKKEALSYWKARSSLYPLSMAAAHKVIIEDVTVPRDRIPAYLRKLQEISSRMAFSVGAGGHAGDGNMHPSIMVLDDSQEQMEKSMQVVREVVKAGLALGGSVSGEHGIGWHKAEFLVEELGQRQVNLMKAIKKAFDPTGIMNPGKIWIDRGTTC